MAKYYAQVGPNGKVHTVISTPNTFVEVASEDERLYGTWLVDGQFVGYHIVLTVDKAEIAADGEDTAIITATVTTWDEQLAVEFDGVIDFIVDGVEVPASFAGGVSQLEFTAEEPGVTSITAKTDSPYLLGEVNTVEIEVVDDAE